MTTYPSLPPSGLYALTPDGDSDTSHLVARVLGALRGGAALVQYRDKHNNPAQRRTRALALVAACQPWGVPLIVNDEVNLAVEVGAAGVHLGRDDGDPSVARAQLGASRIIGVSCYDSLALAREAVAAGADYIAFGSFYASATKPAAVRCPLEVLRRASQELMVPIVAIGGITAENALPLVVAGASLLAVVGALFDSPDTATAARAFAAPLSRLASHTHRKSP